MEARFLPSFGTKHLKFKVGRINYEFLVTNIRGTIETSQLGSINDEGLIIINCWTGKARLFPKKRLNPFEIQEYFGDEFEGMEEDIACSIAEILTKEVMHCKPERMLTRG